MTDSEPIIIKKYANRRLYNTGTSAYITLEDLADMVNREENFVVQDAKTGEDLTHSVLAQIIFDRESKGENLLPVNFLRQLIRFYGNQMQQFVPWFLEASMDRFTETQGKIEKDMGKSFSNPAYDALQQQTRKNMQIFSQYFGKDFMAKGFTAPGFNAVKEEAREDKDSEIDELRAQLAAMQKKLDSIDPQEK